MRQSMQQFLREYSIPLLVGIVAALVWANVAPEHYHLFFHRSLLGAVDLHFLANDVCMVFFFGIAGVEITASVSPGGSLSPSGNAISPLFATVGGIVGPVAVYAALNAIFGGPHLARGWGIPTATDIALAWLVARIAFGADHPAVSFLLLLAIVDDAICLIIIAIFYPDPSHPVNVLPLVMVLAGVGIAFGLRRSNVRRYWPYVLIGGVLSWTGLFLAHLHPALALTVIVPFMPSDPPPGGKDDSTLLTFEHEWKIVVDFGMLMFGLANAGVEFSSIGAATWLVLAGLIVGKTSGIFLAGVAGQMLGFPLPTGLTRGDLLLVGAISGIGLTVALFVAGVAFTDEHIRSAAKMGALLSGAVGPIVLISRFRRGPKSSLPVDNRQ